MLAVLEECGEDRARDRAAIGDSAEPWMLRGRRCGACAAILERQISADASKLDAIYQLSVLTVCATRRGGSESAAIRLVI